MAKSKPSPRFLNRAFERAIFPVYFVNSDYEIAYANQACAEWVGLDLESLVSASCVFTSQDLNDIQNKTQGLCPPPEILNQTELAVFNPRSLAVWATGVDQQSKSWRASEMFPFLDTEQKLLGVLVICQPEQFASADSINDSKIDSAAMDSDRIHAALSQIRTETDRLYCLESLVGSSPFANRLRRQVATAIRTNVDLMIVGPHGSGKEHLARTIHTARDPNSESELIPVYCSIADQQLIQQNIKDIVGGRTTGQLDATNELHDWLLLLDVDQLGEAAQHELLGFFQLPNFPLRSIATSTCSLIELAAQGKYSTDLAHHLSVLTIEQVALSVRQADIPFLAQALIERDNDRREQQLSGFSDEVMQQFIEFDWPENIDQLNRTIQVAARQCSGPQIVETDLPDEFRQALRAMQIGTCQETEIDLEQFLGEVEKELLIRAVKQAKGNKTKASKLLGISRPKLLRRLQFFNIGGSNPEQTQSGEEELDSSAFEELD